MALDPVKHHARQAAAGVITLSAVIAAITIFPTATFAQNRTGKGATAKAPSVTIDLGVLDELGSDASVDGLQAKPSVRAPVLRAPRKRPGAPAPLFLQPRSADERMAKAPLPRAKPTASERGKSIKPTPNDPAPIASADRPPAASADRPMEKAEASPAKPAATKRNTVEQAGEKSVAAVTSKPKTATAKTENRKAAEPAPPASTIAAVAFPTASTEVVREQAETPAPPAKHAAGEAEAASPASPSPSPSLPPAAIAERSVDTQSLQVTAKIEADPTSTSEAAAAPEPPTQTVAEEELPAAETITAEAIPAIQPSEDTAAERPDPMRSAMTDEPADTGRKPEHATEIGEKSATDTKKPGSETIHTDIVPIEKPAEKPAENPRGWMATLIKKVPDSGVSADSDAKHETKAHATAAPAAEQTTAEQTAPMAALAPAQNADVVNTGVINAGVVQVARATPEPAREEPAETRTAFDDPVRLVFSGDGSQLDDRAKSKVQALVNHLKGDSQLRLRLLSYADGKNRSRREARQLSLFRALAVRSHLIKKGISSARIEVRPQGNNATRTPRDRVDLVVSSR